jgi:hypothetical protein
MTMNRDESATTKTDTVPVFINRRKIELPLGPMPIPSVLTEAGFDGTGWDILQLQGEGDPTGGTLLMADATVEIKAGLHFRVLPGNRTFGTAGRRRLKEPPAGKQEGRA